MSYLRGAASYFWGSSSNDQSQTPQTTETNNNANNNNKNNKNNNNDSIETAISSLDISSKKQFQSTDQYPQMRSSWMPKLDGLSATASIEFLYFDPQKPKQIKDRRNLPFYIISNRKCINNFQIIKEISNEDSSSSIEHKNNTEIDSKNKNENKKYDLLHYLETLNLSKDEFKGIQSLSEWLKTEKLSKKLCNEMWISDVVFSYFSSLSPTNPDPFGCWKRWVLYRQDHPWNDVNVFKIKAFLDSGVYSLGFDNNRRPVWFINTQFYNDTTTTETITVATILWISSLMWDLKKNKFDMFALRRGISIYVNMSHWTMNMLSWNIMMSLKAAAIAFPFHCVDMFVVNIPTFMYLIKQIAAKVMVPHAMDKLKILGDANEYFEKYADKHKTPICAGGTLKVHATQWMKDRGFLDVVPIAKHKKSASAPVLIFE